MNNAIMAYASSAPAPPLAGAGAAGHAAVQKLFSKFDGIPSYLKKDLFLQTAACAAPAAAACTGRLQWSCNVLQYPKLPDSLNH